MKLKGIKAGRGKPQKESKADPIEQRAKSDGKNIKKTAKKSKKIKQRNKKIGLTRAEEKRLKTLKKKQKAEENRKIPESTQQTITFETIFRDGICRVRKGYYTKMLHFADMNYELLDDREQDEVLKAYGRFINYFDPAISFQIFLFNRHMGEGAVKSRFEIPAANDGHDDIRDEFSHMLKDLSRKGTNGVEKDRYIIFGIEAETYKEAKARLKTIERDVTKNLTDMGTAVTPIDGRARVRLLYEFFNQYELKPFRFSFEQMKESGNTVKDYIAPPGFDLRFPSRFKSGRMYGSAYYLDLIAPTLTDGIIKRLLDLDDNLTISMHMRTLTPANAMKLIKKNLSDVQSSKINEQKKAVRQGYDMDIMPPDILKDEKDLMEQLKILGSNNEKIIHTSIIEHHHMRFRKYKERT